MKHFSVNLFLFKTILSRSHRLMRKKKNRPVQKWFLLINKLAQLIKCNINRVIHFRTLNSLTIDKETLGAMQFIYIDKLLMFNTFLKYIVYFCLCHDKNEFVL